jgi:hypothetical protein
VIFEEQVAAARPRPQPRKPIPANRRLLAAGTFLLLLAFAILLQWAGGAYACEFGGYPDEPAHYVTGLMVHDYMLSGFFHNPMKFAETFYFHYPKVAFGMWGPLMHLIEGVWMALFSPSRSSVLILMALIAAALAFTLARVIGGEFGWVAGVCAGMTLLATRCVQTYTAMVMADNLCALMDFWAIIWLGRYFRTERRRDAVLFAAFAILAVLTKGNGIALALAPPIAMLITRRFRLLKTLNFWLPAGLVVAIAGPWQYVSSRFLSGIGEVRHVSWSIGAAYVPMIVQILGPWLLPFVLVGIYDRIISPFAARAVEGRWAAAAAMIPAFWLFHWLVPSSSAELRYVAALAAPVLMFFAAGVARVADMLPRRFPYPVRAWVLAVAAAGIFAGTSFAVPQKRSYGFSELADALVSMPNSASSVMLVSSEAQGEGMLVSEIAMRDRRPGRVVLRATKILATVSWHGDHYEPRPPTPEEAQEYLERIPVQFLVLDEMPGPFRYAHHQNLFRMIAMYPDRWQLLGVYPQKLHATAAGSRIQIYQLKSLRNQPRGKVRLDLRYTLGRWIEK